MSSICGSSIAMFRLNKVRIPYCRSPSAITSCPIRSLRMFQTKVPVVEPKSTKVTVPLKGGFGRVEDILFGEERLQVELAAYLY